MLYNIVLVSAMYQHESARCREHIWLVDTGGRGGRRGYNELGEYHWNIYITICKTDSQWEFAVWRRQLKASALALQYCFCFGFWFFGCEACGILVPQSGIQSTFPGSLSAQFSSVQSLSRIRLFATAWIAARQASLSITNSWSLLRRRSIELVMSSNHLILCHLLFLLPSIFPSIRGFSNDLALSIQVAKVSELQLQHQSFQWIFRTDFLHDWLVWSPCRLLSRVFSNITVQKHQFFGAQLYGPTLTSIHDYWKNQLNGPLSAK